MQKIYPCLWFNTQAEEAVAFYTSVFTTSSVGTTLRYDKASAEVSGQKEGSVLTVAFTLHGQDFLALNGGPQFSFTPAISFFVHCSDVAEVDRLYGALSEGGSVLMALDKYPFSERYAWVSDKYGVSWQIILGERAQKITPSFLFVGDVYGKAKEAIETYTSLFPNSKIETTVPYGPGSPIDKEDALMYSLFQLCGQDFIAMDSGYKHEFGFSLATSLIVTCETQEEIDRYWALSANPSAEQCGWLKDKYGVSWQINPRILDELLADPDPVKATKAMQAMLTMKKIDIAQLKQAVGI